MPHDNRTDPGIDRRSPVFPIIFLFMAIAVSLLSSAVWLNVFRADPICECKNMACECKPDERIDKILFHIAELDGRKPVVEKVMVDRVVFVDRPVDRFIDRPVEKVVEKIVYKDRLIEKKVFIDRVPVSLLESLREAEERISRWKFFDGDEEKQRRKVVEHLRKAINEIGER